MLPCCLLLHKLKSSSALLLGFYIYNIGMHENPDTGYVSDVLH